VTELPIQQILLDVVAIIERLQIPYAVMGGFAARAWGLPRPTYDADVAVAVDADALQRLFDALELAGFNVPPEHRTGFLDVIAGFKKATVNRFLAPHVWHTDLFVAGSDFLGATLARARHAKIGPKQVRIMAPEDVILLKLIAHRRKDLADVEEIIDVCKNLDLPYLYEWADKLKLNDRLAEFLPKRP
jgi:hypothetical protein